MIAAFKLNFSKWKYIIQALNYSAINLKLKKKKLRTLGLYFILRREKENYSIYRHSANTRDREREKSKESALVIDKTPGVCITGN